MIGSVLLFLIVLSVLVLVHEAGHFFTALWMGAKVEEFGVGFPPRAYSKIRNGIRYSINWIPLGGFVKIKGETAGDQADPDSFASKPAWKRFIVLVAGVVMNIVLAVVLLSIGLGMGLPKVVDDSLPASARVRDPAITIVQVLKDSAADQSGIELGDQLVSINNQTFSTSEAAQQYIGSNVESPLQIEVKRGEETVSVMVQPAATVESGDRKILGVGLVKTGIVSYPWYLAPVYGVVETLGLTKEIFSAFGGMLRNLVVHQQLAVDVSGPVGIAVMTGEVASMGFVYLLQFAALLSINLAVINVLPFPALDGGRILFVIIEKIIGRPVKGTIETVAHNIGFALLMILVILVTYRDVARLAQGLWN